MKVFIHINIYLISSVVFGQTLEFGNDTILCPGDQVELIGEAVDSSQFILFSSPDTLSLPEDLYSDTINIGFDFTFYDSTYSKVVIGQNGILTFDVSKAVSYNNWIINDPIPTTNLDANNIMFPFVDIQGGSAPYVYETLGSAPNRYFVVQKLCGYLFGCPTESTSTLILYENTNEIEIHIGKKEYCSWNSNSAIQGLHHRNSQIADVVNGRNYGDNWTALREGKKWSPNGINDYTITTIPYKIAVDTITYAWNNTLGDSFPYSDTLVVIGQALGDSVGYFLGLASDSSILCGDFSLSNDTSWINQDFQTHNLDKLDDFCNGGIGEIYSTFTNSSDSWYFWTDQTLFSDTLTGLNNGWYEYVYTGNNGCSLTDSIEVLNENSFSYEVDSIICFGQNNGGIQIFPDLPYFSYDWIDFPNNSTNSLSNIGSGSYSCDINSSIGCSSSISVIIPEGNGLIVDNLSIMHESCYNYDNGNFIFDAFTTYPPLLISWEGNTIVDQEISDIPPGSYLLNIIDSMGCVYDSLITINEITDSLTQTVLTSPESLGDDGEAFINASGGTQPYQYNIGNGFSSLNSYSDLTTGNYESIVMDENGCLDTLMFFVDSEVRLEDESVAELIIYPNPANENVLIQLAEKVFKLAIYDQLGRLIFHSEDNMNQKSINVSCFSEGIYRLNVITSEFTYQRVLIVD